MTKRAPLADKPQPRLAWRLEGGNIHSARLGNIILRVFDFSPRRVLWSGSYRANIARMVPLIERSKTSVRTAKLAAETWAAQVREDIRKAFDEKEEP